MKKQAKITLLGSNNNNNNNNNNNIQTVYSALPNIWSDRGIRTKTLMYKTPRDKTRPQ